MKGFTKMVLILAGVITTVGIGLSIGGVAMGATAGSIDVGNMLRTHTIVFDDDWDDWDEDSGHHTVYTPGSKETASFHDIREMKINLRYDQLIFQEYDGDEITVKVENDPDKQVKIKESDHKLEIRSDKKRNNREVIIGCPKGTVFEQLDIEMKAGVIDFQAPVKADELDVSVGAGQFTNTDTIQARELDIQVGMGSANLMQVAADQIEAECGMGELSLSVTGKKSDYQYKLECGIGEIDLDGESHSGIGAEKTIHSADASKYMDLQCAVGSISVTFE